MWSGWVRSSRNQTLKVFSIAGSSCVKIGKLTEPLLLAASNMGDGRLTVLLPIVNEDHYVAPHVP
jgi:hypothetical protein